MAHIFHKAEDKNLCSCKAYRKGYKHESLLSIDFCDIVPDDLHLKIRIGEKNFLGMTLFMDRWMMDRVSGSLQRLSSLDLVPSPVYCGKVKSSWRS